MALENNITQISGTVRFEDSINTDQIIEVEFTKFIPYYVGNTRYEFNLVFDRIKINRRDISGAWNLTEDQLIQADNEIVKYLESKA